ncbi:MAG: pilus assembly FimT family protein [Planctomycetota bacterium]
MVILDIFYDMGKTDLVKKGFSIIELIIIVLFIGALAAIAVPRVNFDIVKKSKTEITAKKIVTDLRRTRSLAISDAANNTQGFQLQMLGGTPYSGYRIDNLDTSEKIDEHSINPDVNCSGESLFKFGPIGNLLSGSDAQLTVTGSGKSFTITVVSATGTVKCLEN